MTVRASSVLGGMRRLFEGGSVAASSERQLLDRFLISRDEAAFEAIVARHGPMVVGVCRAVLSNPVDVDDAFQATFLVLVKKAGSLRDGDQLSPWLHGVARKVALRARANSAKRRGWEKPGGELAATAPDRPALEAEQRELRALLHAELDRLSPPERSVLLLCDLQGLSHQEAADQLGWPLGTVKARITRGRDRLRSRLIRRGVSLSTSALASTLLGESVASAVVPPTLLLATTRAALAIAAGRVFAVTLVSPPVFHLTQGAARAMILTKFKALALALAATTTALAVPGVVAYQAQRQATNAGAKAASIDQHRLNKELEIPIAGEAAEEPPAPASPEVQAKNLAILKKLEEPIPFKKALSGFAGKGGQWPSFEGLAQIVEESTIDAQLGLPKGIPVVFSVLGRKLAQGKNINMPELLAHDATTPLRVALTKEAKWFGLEYRVSNGTLRFDLASDLLDGNGLGLPNDQANADKRRRDDDEERNEAIRAKLDKVVSMKFPNKVSLNELLAFVKKATEEPKQKSIPIYVDPTIFVTPNQSGIEGGYADANVAAITIELDDVPLRTSLRLALRQMNLQYAVSGGLLIISQPQSIAQLMAPSNTGGMGGMGGGGMGGGGIGSMGGGGMGGRFRSPGGMM